MLEFFLEGIWILFLDLQLMRSVLSLKFLLNFKIDIGELRIDLEKI